MQTTLTAQAVLLTMIADASRSADFWVRDLELSTFPKTGVYADNPEIQNHPACGHWHWVDWDRFTVDYEYILGLLRDTAGCEEVSQAREQLFAKVEPITRFRTATAESIDDFCS